jgi:hypothetical protein
MILPQKVGEAYELTGRLCFFSTRLHNLSKYNAINVKRTESHELKKVIIDNAHSDYLTIDVTAVCNIFSQSWLRAFATAKLIAVTTDSE